MLGNAEQRTEGMKKQAQELIELTYLSGYQKAEEDYYIQTEKDRESSYQLGIEVGRNEAWKAARKIMSQNDASWGMKEMKEIFGSSYSTDIMHDLSASEAIEKISEYEEQKKQEEDSEIHVGDEVILNENSSYSANTKAIVIANDNNARYYKYNVMVSYGDTEWVDKNALDGRTGRTFPQIAEVLKKMKEEE